MILIISGIQQKNNMKTIKAIKGTKQIELGTIKRVEDKEADSEVKSGYWSYIPKNEWKKNVRVDKPTPNKTKEKNHHMYKQACDEELRQIKEFNNMNFEGIGLPDDLIEN